MDNDIARVLSWHLSGDMDCVITLTTDKVRPTLVSNILLDLKTSQENLTCTFMLWYFRLEILYRNFFGDFLKQKRGIFIVNQENQTIV